MTEKKLNLMVDTPPESRFGRFADTFFVRTNGPASTVDFILTDGPPDEDGNVPALLVSRVSMTNEALLALRDMLNDHTSGWKVSGDGS